jgi:xanthine dehydrogenase accessory factor
MASINAEIARVVLEALESGDPVATATVIRSPDGGAVPVSTKMLVRADGSGIGDLGNAELDEAVRRACLETLPKRGTRLLRIDAAGRAVDGRHERSTYDVLIEVIETPPLLLIVGAGHIGRSLCAIGALLGFYVSVLDDRPDYANHQRLPEADQVLCEDFEAALQQFPITRNTYIVMVSRGHKQDELSLRQVVSSRAAYVGMIGSKRRTSTVLQHLAEEGFPREALDAVHTPIGLDIGAETPEEIAVSILAEIIMLRRGGTGNVMYYRRGAAARV